MAAGDPTGTDLCSGTTDGDTLGVTFPPDYTEREITIDSPVELTSGVVYAIVVRALSGDATNYIAWNVKSGGTYSGGLRADSSDSGSSWLQLSSYDMWFTTKASGVAKDNYAFSGTGGGGALQGSNWGTQTFTASSTYTISSIVLKLARKNTPGTVTVSIKATVGAPTKATTPAPGNAASNVTLDQATLTWVDGGGADTFNVYYGDTSGSLSLVSSAQAGTSFTVTGITLGSPYNYLVTRYWRIDSTNTAGTTTGDEWSFTTIRLDPPGATYFYSTTGQYYRLLVQSDGSYGGPPGVGVENTDYVFLSASYEPNFMSTNRKLVSIANSKVWFEDL